MLLFTLLLGTYFVYSSSRVILYPTSSEVKEILKYEFEQSSVVIRQYSKEENEST